MHIRKEFLENPPDEPFFLAKRHVLTPRPLPLPRDSGKGARTRGGGHGGNGEPPRVGVGVRVTRNIRVGFFGFSKIRVLKIETRKLLGKKKTRQFGYP
jgi:hypothetical protein